MLSAVRVQDAEDGENRDEEEGDATVEDELCAADMLAEMAQGLHDRLPPFPPDGGASADIRLEVLRMLEHYLEGQRDILQSLVAFAQEKEASALQRAKELGLDVVEEEEEEE